MEEESWKLGRGREREREKHPFSQWMKGRAGSWGEGERERERERERNILSHSGWRRRAGSCKQLGSRLSRNDGQHACLFHTTGLTLVSALRHAVELVMFGVCTPLILLQ